ncbi:MAG: hypothetical protein KDC90_18265, partial [Ignavibacteriae bacterium]|nr:hypothetical protein [Ignavibacteriota bacterium]
MLNNIKLHLFDNLNVLNKFAKQGKPSFPDDICVFLSNELNLKNVLLFEEVSENNFKQIGKSSNPDDITIQNSISIIDYTKFKDQFSFEGKVLSECKIDLNLDSDNLHAVIFNLNKNKFCVAIILHKILPAIEDRQKYLAIFEFVKSQLLIWQNEDKIKLNKPAENELVFSSIKGLEKEIKTINGLLTLAKEENPTNGVNKYLDQIKKSHQFISASLDDLNESLSIQSKGLDHNKTSFGIKLFWDNLLAKKLEELPNCKIQLHNVSEKEISFDEKSLSKILNIAINFSADLTESNEVLIQSSITPSNKLHVSVISKNAKIKSEELISLQVPFSKRENIKTISGLSIQLIQQIVLQLNGTINYIIDGNDIHTNISLPVGNDSPKSVHEILKNKSAAD